MSDRRERPRVGELRPSQILTTFGVGSIIDLPHLSVMVMGLEDWPTMDSREINEERLLASVKHALGRQVFALRSPPVIPESDRSSPFEEQAAIGVPVAPFPRWMVCPHCRRLAPLSSRQFALKADPYRPDRVRYVHENCRAHKPPTAIPARFVVACKNGHLDDFPWVEFIHRGRTNCPYKLQLVEAGVSGEAADVFARCETCDRSRPMSDAFSVRNSDLPECRGRRPHLRDFDENPCLTENGNRTQVRAMLQGASNSWFPLMLTALSVPQSTDLLEQLVTDAWSDLYDIEGEGDIAKLRRRNLLREFADYSTAELWVAIQHKQAADQGADEPSEPDAGSLDLKTPEWKVFTDPENAPRTKDFRLQEVVPPERFQKYFDRIVLTERLREVRALIGFTRIESPGDYEDPSEFPDDQRMSISRFKPKWVPANEIRGEGLFIQFNEEEISDWLLRVPELDRQFFAAHKGWRQARGLPKPEDNYPGARFVLIHSFAHALIRQLSLECGYTAASLRERIYSRNAVGSSPPMAGVLIYTAAPDSEGTLGGLVSLGKPEVLERHLNQALDSMRLCSSDPLCAEHQVGTEGTTLHAASCHSCLFTPETSCERGNKYLDRSVLVPTVDQEFFSFFDLPEVNLEINKELGTDAQIALDEEPKSIDLYDLVSLPPPEGVSRVTLPSTLQKLFKLKEKAVEFRFLGEKDQLPKKNTIAIVRHDELESNGVKVKLACGKLLWSKQKSVDTGESSILLTIKGTETAKLRLPAKEWEFFRPLAVIHN
jgi:hypothetical protein